MNAYSDVAIKRDVVGRGQPRVINEQLVTRFHYWQDGIQQGMSYNHELYALVEEYERFDRLRAYEVANECSMNALDTCITVSSSSYAVWVGLRSLAARQAVINSPELDN
ncbi:MAG: hypothetical protein NZ772_10805 [Cyanobacteria bacterium]|nr:hypothetical protein [Cyanobacteriota bacterium]